MKKLFMILPLALILCVMVGCQDKAAMAELEAFKAQAAVEEQNKEIVKRYYELMDQRNPEFLELLSEGYVAHFPGGVDFTGFLKKTFHGFEVGMLVRCCCPA